jgi:hypothetical protein
MATLLTILGFGLFIFAIRTVNRWDGDRIPIQVHVMIWHRWPSGSPNGAVSLNGASGA